MSEPLPAIEIETAPNPAFSVIWMHGLGADGSDFVPVVAELGLPDTLGVRFIFPHAPAISVTCNGGYVMPAWYDIYSLDEASRRADERGILQSREAIRTLITRENARGVASDHIVLAGFSQGGAIAYTTALTHPEKLAGVIALSAYIPSTDLIASEAAPANATTPIFAAHGTEDDIVPLMLGTRARDWLAAAGHPVTWQTYRMPHSVCIEEIVDTGQWLTERFA